MRFPKILFAFLAAAAVHAAPVSAEQVSAEARAVPSKTTVGGEVRLVVRVERPKAYSVEPPSGKLKLAPFEVKRVDLSPEATGKNRVVDTFLLTLTAFETGDLKIPAFDVAYTDGTGRAGRVTVPSVSVKVESVAGKLTGKEDIKPIKGPLSLDFGALRTAALGAAAALLTFLLVFLVVRRRSRRAFVDPETLLPPHERAMREFERLQSKGWLEAGEAKAYYDELSGILRRYLTRRFGIEALELTSAETLAEMKRKDFPRSVTDRVREVFETADLAKFAKQVPPRVAGERARTALMEAVDATKPEEPKKGEKK